jgi:hypothetical protein
MTSIFPRLPPLFDHDPVEHLSELEKRIGHRYLRLDYFSRYYESRQIWDKRREAALKYFETERKGNPSREHPQFKYPEPLPPPPPSAKSFDKLICDRNETYRLQLQEHHHRTVEWYLRNTGRCCQDLVCRSYCMRNIQIPFRSFKLCHRCPEMIPLSPEMDQVEDAKNDTQQQQQKKKNTTRRLVWHPTLCASCYLRWKQTYNPFNYKMSDFR